MPLPTRRRIALIALVAAGILPVAGAEEVHLLPRLGETSAEFDARVRGLARPASPTVPLSVTLVADAKGHFFVEPTVNGSRIRMMVDTGASIVALSKEDARRIGISPQPADFKTKISTANGFVMVAPVVLKDVTIGNLVVHDVQAAVFPDNRLQFGLLGMSFLSKLSHFEVAAGRLVLKR